MTTDKELDTTLELPGFTDTLKKWNPNISSDELAKIGRAFEYTGQLLRTLVDTIYQTLISIIDPLADDRTAVGNYVLKSAINKSLGTHFRSAKKALSYYVRIKDRAP